MAFNISEIFTLVKESLSDDELQNICLCHFRSIHKQFTDGQTKDFKIRLLVEHIDRNQHEMSKLLNEIKKICPNAYQVYVNQINNSSDLLNFPEVSKFDLTNLTEQCLEEILYRNGVIGLSICCSDYSFLKHLCDRLKQSLHRNNVQSREIIKIKPQLNSINNAIRSIINYRQLLIKGDVICPIIINVNNSNLNIIKDFWCEIQNSFAGKFDHRLIIIIIVDGQDFIFPSDILSLSPPRFHKVHVSEWIGNLTCALHRMQDRHGWEEVANIWIDKMHERCQYEERSLDMGSVYDHLEFILSELNCLNEKPSISPQDFLNELYL
jgi:Effector-associated domain 7